MSILQHAKRNFAARPRQEIEVPEWADESGKPTTVYFKTANPATIDKVTTESQGRSLEMCARLICLVAQDADGKPLFGPMDWDELMLSTEHKVLDRIASKMMRAAKLSTEDSLKK
jgi:hypothetical protein